jgi:formylglycine-generating enzyme required for sulfatase activity
MLGNVAEWCADPLVDYPKRGWSATDPVAVVPAGPDVRYVVRGGAWAPPGAARCRAAARFGFNPTLATNWVGLRICVADAPVPVDAGAATVSAPK